MIRNIIKIDEDLCTGCGKCIIGCPEGAIELIDGKAKLVSENYCDGLGACIGQCPEGAITIEKRETQPYDEKIVMDNIVKEGPEMIEAHLEHLETHGEDELLRQALEYLDEKNIKYPEKYDNASISEEIGHDCGFNCPGMKAMTLEQENNLKEKNEHAEVKQKSELTNWPIQIKLAPVEAAYYKNADLLIAADCVAASNPNFHSEFVKGKTLLMGCPKLDNANYYIEKLSQIFQANNIKTITSVIMTVPCCNGLNMIVERALMSSGKTNSVPWIKHTIDIHGHKV